MTPRTLNNQDGIAIGPILFIIAILALLAAAIAAGSGGFTASTNTDSAKVLAQAIIDYAEQVKTGVNTVSANGCGDLSSTTSSINFDNSFTSGYTNPYAPSDHSCDVFNVAGGGIMYKTVPLAALNTAFAASFDYGFYGIYAQPKLQNVGPSQQDLILMVPYLSDAVCLQINNILGFSSTPVSAANMADANNQQHFAGTFPGVLQYVVPSSYQAQCINAKFSQVLGINVAYFLLLAR